MKFIKSFYGCKNGEIYPTKFSAGDECPDELLKAAKSVGAVGVQGGKGAERTKATDKAGANGSPDA